MVVLLRPIFLYCNLIRLRRRGGLTVSIGRLGRFLDCVDASGTFLNLRVDR